jgi:DNA helicase II / ATP-dependent DNA helicase PcrA
VTTTNRFTVSSLRTRRAFANSRQRIKSRPTTKFLSAEDARRVVEMANALIAHNHDREDRALTAVAANGPGDISILQYHTLEHEAAGIAELVADLIDDQRYEPQDILILAQRRSVGNPIHDALSGHNIPSKSYCQEGALDSQAVQERLAILKLLTNREDRIALRWLLGFGSNDFRTGAYGRIRTRCEQTGESPWDVMEQLTNGAIRITHTQPSDCAVHGD